MSNLDSIFNEVYNNFITGNYSVANPKNRDQKKKGKPSKMDSTQALKEVVNYLIWEWCQDNNDQLFNTLVEEINIPPTDYDLSKVTFTEMLEVVCPELIKTSDIVKEHNETSIKEVKKLEAVSKQPKQPKQLQQTEEAPKSLEEALQLEMTGFDIS